MIQRQKHKSRSQYSFEISANKPSQNQDEHVFNDVHLNDDHNTPGQEVLSFW